MQYYTHGIESCLDIIVNPIKELELLDAMYVVSAVPGNSMLWIAVIFLLVMKPRLFDALSAI